AGTCAARSGAVLVNGRDVTALPPHRRVGAGAFLIPEGRGIFPALSVEENLALAPALVRPPQVLVVGEPSLGLAPRVVEAVHASLRELRDAGVAVLLVEEKANDALALADRVAFLSVGTVAWQAGAADVDEDLLVRSYLGMELEPT
ncbi:MAG TPA: hypothetical protein VFZ77_12275, partial [Acidimicrobiales bacterium]